LLQYPIKVQIEAESSRPKARTDLLQPAGGTSILCGEEWKGLRLVNSSREQTDQMGRRRARLIWFAMIVAAVLAAAFFWSMQPTSRPEAPILMICVDGLEMSVLRPMLERGELSNLAALIDRGVFGYLTTFAPAKSPVVWTTVATGKEARKHGITDFIDETSKGPFTSNARRVKALWNIADDSGLTCNVIGYWNTWPAEEIDGRVVSQFSSSTQRQYQNMVKGSLFRDLDGATWPPECIDEIWPLVAASTSAERLLENVSIPVFGDLRGCTFSAEVEDLVKSSFWSFEADAGYHAAACWIFEQNQADLNIVYYGGPDVIAHRFWRYRQPEFYSYEIPEKEIATFRRSIEEYYSLMDRMIGDLVELFPEKTRILVLSDHGMHPDFADGTAGGTKTNLSAHHLDGPAGVLVAAGFGIRTDGIGIRTDKGLDAFLDSPEPAELGSVFDITPTVLYLLDIPVGRDMNLGKVQKNILSPAQIQNRAIEFVDSHDEGFRPPTPSLSSEDADREFRDRMRKLGYLR